MQLMCRLFLLLGTNSKIERDPVQGEGSCWKLSRNSDVDRVAIVCVRLDAFQKRATMALWMSLVLSTASGLKEVRNAQKRQCMCARKIDMQAPKASYMLLRDCCEHVYQARCTYCRRSLHDAIDINATLRRLFMRGRHLRQVEIALSNGQRAVSTELHYIGLNRESCQPRCPPSKRKPVSLRLCHSRSDVSNGHLHLDSRLNAALQQSTTFSNNTARTVAILCSTLAAQAQT